MKRIITIGREFGAGGGTLGRRLAKELGIEYYDRDIILATAKASAHLTPEQVRQWDERVPKEFGFTQSLFNFYSKPLGEELWNAQVHAIRELADKESCVIVGRCADHVLAGTERLVRIFIYADMEARIQRIREKGYYEEHEIARNIRRMDRERRDYHRYYTGKEWENVENYDMMLNSGVLGTDGCVECILSYLKIRGLYPA